MCAIRMLLVWYYGYPVSCSLIIWLPCQL